MRRIAFATFVLATSFAVAACHRSQDFNYTSADANEDAALNNLESEDGLAQAAGATDISPDENGPLPDANAQ